MMNLNKIDPRILQIVVEKTAKSTVHKKENAFVEKDGKHRHENKVDLEEIKKRIRQINRILEENEIGIYLILNQKNIKIMVREKSSDKILTVLDEDDLENILKVIHSKSGIILDMKG